MNGHFAAVGDRPTAHQFEHGVQVIDEEKEFNTHLNDYLRETHVAEAGFNYHLISVFGSQSTGKSTLLNHLFGTGFSVMSEAERRQTTKGIWMAKNKKARGAMADNILVMDVEGTDGRERGEDQDFERKSALFALATSEVLIVNIWEHQVGLYQGANMGLLKTVFEVNLQLFVKDSQASTRSLLFFVIRDHIGTTPLANLRNTLIADLTKIWSTISKPPGLERSRIEDYFDFSFAALPHKILQPDQFVAEVDRLGTRFAVGHRAPASKTNGDVASAMDVELHSSGGVFLPEYHRRIPADGLSIYAEGVWDQIVNNKDLDLPTQQELLAQFRCDEIAREVLVAFDAVVQPLEERQAEELRRGKSSNVLPDLGATARDARKTALAAFEVQAGRYHKGVYGRKRTELETKIDARLRALFQAQLAAAHKAGVGKFGESVAAAVKAGQKAGGSYEFAEIADREKRVQLDAFRKEAAELKMEGVAWTDFAAQAKLFETELDEVGGRLRKEEMRRLATRVERWVRSRLGDAVGLEFNRLGSGRAGTGASLALDAGANKDGEGSKKKATAAASAASVSPEKDLWDRIWALFATVVREAEARFAERAKSLEASAGEVEVGLWRLRRKSWTALRERVAEEVMEGNILLKLRENFEDKFRYDEDGVPRIWRPTDDIEGMYTRARESTLALIPLLSHFRLAATFAPPDLGAFVGAQPAAAEADDEEDLVPIGGVDEEEGKSLEEETTVLSESKRQDLVVRFRKTADGVYVEAKRSAIGGITQVPLYFYGILLLLGWNEILVVVRNPFLFMLLILLMGGTWIAYHLNLLGPMIQMTNAATNQAVEIGKERLRDFLQNNEMARQALSMPANNNSSSNKTNGTRPAARDRDNSDAISLDTLDSKGKRRERTWPGEDADL